MRFTPPIPLEPANIDIDAYDLAISLFSVIHSSQLSTLRWGKVSEVDMIKYLTAVYAQQIPTDAKIPRLGAKKEDGKGTAIERREHLVIRDLDLLPRLVEQDPDAFQDNPEAKKLGRIVAHADYRFRPKGWDFRKPNHPDPQANARFLSIPKPEGANVKLVELLDEKVEELLNFHFKGSDCYELYNISTNASHLRKGLAKQLVKWLYPFCDEDGLDYKLLASPMGRGLYRSCGFVEEGEGDAFAAEIDMSEWGGEGIHQHVYMVRHPEIHTS